MPDAPNPELPNPDDAAYRRVLATLLDVGTSIAQELKTPSAEITLAARANAFARVDEALRRTIILSRHIAENALTAPEARRIKARKRVIRAVEETIDAKANPADTGTLRLELIERVDSLDFDFDLTHRSTGELIQELCRDLGLANIPGRQNFPRRTPDDIALLCAQAAAPAGSGLPQWLAAAIPQATKNDTANDIRLKED